MHTTESLHVRWEVHIDLPVCFVNEYVRYRHFNQYVPTNGEIRDPVYDVLYSLLEIKSGFSCKVRRECVL